MTSQKLIYFLYTPIFLISILLGVVAPRTLAFSVPILGLFSLLVSTGSVAGRDVLNRYLVEYRRFAFLLVGIILIATLSLIWGISFEVSSERLIKTLPILGLGFFIPLVWRQLDKSCVPYLLSGILFVLLFGLLLVCEELLFDMPFYRYVKGYSPTEWFHPSFLNRQTIFISLMFFLVYPAVFHVRELPMKWFFMVLIPIVLGCVLLMTESQGCQLAMMVGCLTYFLFPYRLEVVWLVFKIIVVTCFLLAPWIAFIGFDLLAEHMKDYAWMQNGYAAERLEIWNFISLRILESPLYGFGMDTTRIMTDFETQKLYHPDTSILHPHNFALQIWIEFGVIGAILGSAFLWVLFDFIERIQVEWLQKSILSFVMATLVVAAIGYGLWQGWWLGLFLMGIGFMGLINRTVGSKKEIPESQSK